MSNFFNVDNGFFSALSKLCDVLFLSVVWVLLCIPVITIGPANTALYYATVKVIRRERGYLFREFFKSFRSNFARGAIVGVVLTIVYAILVMDIIASRSALGTSSTTSAVLFGIYLALFLFVTGFTIYVFPILSRFEMNIRQLIKAAIFMSFRHLPYTIVMLVIMVAAIFGVIYIPITIFIIPATATLIISLLMERVLKKYIPKSENMDEDSSKDEWYLE